jgi:hypothetical protein
MRFHNSPRWIDSRLSGRARAVGICAGKTRHLSFGSAAAHLRALVKRFGPQSETLRPYSCSICGGWHLGRSREGVQP